MKYILIFVFILNTIFIFAQSPFQESVISSPVFEFQGNVTETNRDALLVPTDQVWLIYNSTSNQFEYAADDQVWRLLNEAGGTSYFFIPVTSTELSDASNAHKLAVITSDFDLGGNELTLAEGLQLRAAGGVFSNGTLKGVNSGIDERVERKLFDVGVQFSGTWMSSLWFKPEWYGANEMADDFTALKATFENWDQINLVGNYEYNSNDQIFLDGPQRSVHIKGEGKIENNSNTHITGNMITVRYIKRLQIDRLQIDGKFKANGALYLKNCPEYIINNLDIQNLKNSGTGYSRAIGVRLDIYEQTTLKGDNWTLKEFNGGSNGQISSGIGVSRCLYINVNYLGAPQDVGTKVEISNSKFHWAYGDDGDLLDIIDQDYLDLAEHRFIFDNCEFKYYSRRASKGSAGGIQYYNCVFDTADEATLTSRMGGSSPQPSGYVNVRNPNESAFPNYRNSYGAIVNCTFNNTGLLSIGSGNSVIIENTNGVLVESNTFNNTKIVLAKNVSGIIIENNYFIDGGINIWGGIIWEDDRSSISYNRATISGNAFALVNATGDIHNINICENNIRTDETLIPNFLGVIRQTAGTGSNVNMINNKIYRSNHQSKHIMYSSGDWDATCRIIDNTSNLNSGPGIFFSGGINSAVTSGNTYNMTGGLLPSRGVFTPR